MNAKSIQRQLVKPFVVNAVTPEREDAFLVRTSREMHQQVKSLADKNGLSINELTLQMIDYCLKQINSGDDVNEVAADRLPKPRHP